MDSASGFSIDIMMLLGAGLVLFSIFASQISGRFGVPALLIFLGVGMLAGSDGPGGLFFDNALIAKSLGIVALAVILFTGGISTHWPTVRPVLWRGISLATIGVLATALSVGLFCTFYLRLPFLEAFLLGSIISSTDAAAVFSVLKSKNISLKRQLQPLLELESGSNDPMAVFLTLSFIGLITDPAASWVSMLGAFARQAVFGALIGWLFGKLMSASLNKMKLHYEGLYPVMILMMALASYAASERAGGSGFLSVYVAGLTLSQKDFLYKRSVLQFHDGIAWLMQIAMFLVLGLLVYPHKLIAIALPGLLVAVFLMFVARPVGVMISLLFAKMTANEKRMVSWVGLRGAAPIVLATFALLARVPHADTIFNIVFFVVFLSVLLQGTTIPFVAKLLKVDAPITKKRRYPIEFEQVGGADTELIEFIVPYNSACAGKAIYQLGLPAEECLVTLVCRDEKFILASGKTTIEEGDVLLALVNPSRVKEVQSILAKQKPKAPD